MNILTGSTALLAIAGMAMLYRYVSDRLEASLPGPVTAVLAVSFLYPLVGVTVVPVFSLLLPAVIIGSAVWYFFQENTAGTALDSGERRFLLFIGILNLGLFWSANKLYTYYQIRYFTVFFLWFWLVRRVSRQRRLADGILSALLSATVCLTAYAWYQRFFGLRALRDFVAAHPEMVPATPEFARRLADNAVFATFGYAPAFAAFLSMLIVVAAAWLLEQAGAERRRWGIILAGIVLEALLLITLTWTRGKTGVLGVMSGGVVLIWLGAVHVFGRRRRLSAGLFGGAALVLGVVIWLGKVLLPKAVVARSLAVRLDYWRSAWTMMAVHPLGGWGPGSFGTVYPIFKVLGAEETVMAHNSYLQLWAETGAIGTIAALLCAAAVAASVIQYWKRASGAGRWRAAGAIAALAAFVVENLVDFSLYHSQVMFTAVTFAAVGARLPVLHTEPPPPGSRRSSRLLAVVLVSLVLLFEGTMWYAHRMVEQAHRQAQSGQAERAWDDFRQAMCWNPLSAVLAGECGDFAHRMSAQAITAPDAARRWRDRAIQSFSRCIRLDPFNSQWQYRMGVLLSIDPESRPQALSYLQTAVRLYPLHPFYHEQLADFYAIMKNPEMAEQEKRLAQWLRRYYYKGTKR